MSADDAIYFPSVSVPSREKKVVTPQCTAQCVPKAAASRWHLCSSEWCGRLVPVLLLSGCTILSMLFNALVLISLFVKQEIDLYLLGLL